MSDFQQTITSLDLLHTSLYRMELFMNAQAVKNAKTDVISLISRLEKAERERDELRLEIARIGGAKAIEVLRRDAAAVEPVAVISEDSLAELKQSYRPVLAFRPDHKRNSPGISLYTAAQPAVLPPEMKPEPEKYDVIDHGFIAGYNQCRADALELGAQQQKPVAEVEELSMQIRRLVHSLKNSNPDSSLLKSVPNYMQRKGYWKATDCLRGEHD